MSNLNVNAFVRVANDRLAAEDAFDVMEKEIEKLLKEKNSWDIDTSAEDREKTDKTIAYYVATQNELINMHPDLKK